MGLRIGWSSRGGLRLSGSAKLGRLGVGESVPLTKGRDGRKRKVRKWASFRF